MKRESFQQALMATAKITCCASIFGLSCAPKDKPVLANATPSSDAIEDPIPKSKINPKQEECFELIETSFAQQKGFADPETLSQEVKDCCELTAEYYDALTIQEDGSQNWTIISEWQHREQCCSAISWQSNTIACTPWGPPIPPHYQSFDTIRRPLKLQRIRVHHA